MAATPGSRLRVLRTPLAEALGFPIDQDALTRWIDPRNGDYEDRLMACPAREPCVPQVDVDGDDRGDGTCGRVSECLEPGTPLLDHLFQGLEVRLGSAPVRRGQIGLCVPNGPDGDLTGDVCAGPHASGTGTNRSYLSRVEDAGADGTCSPGMSLATDVCMSCSDGVRDTADPGVSGVPRLCVTDLDCEAELDCTGPTGCIYDTARGRRTSFCTHLNVPFDGVPAGQGFCARPRLDCAADMQFARPLPDWHYPRTALVRLCPPPPVPPAPLSRATSRTMCRSPNAVNGAMDFEPAALECVARGCAGCTGAWGYQTYCTDDTECPSQHRCVVAENDVLAPACLLRPILGDGRFQDSRDATLQNTRIPSVSGNAAQFLADVRNVPGVIRTGIDSLTDIARSVPTRSAVTFESRQCSGSSVTRRGLRMLLYSLAATTRGAMIRMVPDPVGSLPGAGQVILDIFVDGRIGFGGRLEGNASLGASHGFDTDMTGHVDAESVRISLRPYVAYEASGAPHLRLRVLGANIMRHASRTDLSGTVAEGSHIHVDSSTQQDDALRVLLGILSFAISELLITTGFENWDAALSTRPGIGSGGVGDGVSTSVFTEALAPLLFGEEIFPGLQTTTLEGVTVELAQDFSVDPSADDFQVFPSLGLYARRAPPPAPLNPRTAGSATLLHTGPAVCEALGERSGDCLETAADPETQCRCGGFQEPCCGGECNAGIECSSRNQCLPTGPE